MNAKNYFFLKTSILVGTFLLLVSCENKEKISNDCRMNNSTEFGLGYNFVGQVDGKIGIYDFDEAMDYLSKKDQNDVYLKAYNNKSEEEIAREYSEYKRNPCIRAGFEYGISILKSQR